MPPKGKQGTATGSVEYSPAKIKRMRAQKAAQERRWAAMAGPVEVRQVGAQSSEVIKPASE